MSFSNLILICLSLLFLAASLVHSKAADMWQEKYEELRDASQIARMVSEQAKRCKTGQVLVLTASRDLKRVSQAFCSGKAIHNVEAR